jgi:hypothetical protein
MDTIKSKWQKEKFVLNVTQIVQQNFNIVVLLIK